MRLRVLLTVCGLTAFVSLVSTSAASAAATGCASRVIQEWHDGRISLGHAPSCYRSALANLPEDMLVYSSAQDDIQRALQARLTVLAAQRTTAGQRAGTTRARALAADAKASKAAQAAGRRVAFASIPTSADNSLPIPVLVAAGAALLLVGLASASRVARRFRRQTSRG